MEHRRIAVFAFFLVVCFSAGYARAPRKMKNGRDAMIEDFPSTALLWMGGWSCGGIIYDERHIITVAHCLEGILTLVDLKTHTVGEYGVFIVAGTTEYGPERNPDVEFAIEKMIVHPEFRHSPMYQNDIGIIKLKEPMTFNEYRRPMKLPEEEAPESGDAVAIGWGKVVDRKFVLKQFPMHIEPRDTCSPRYQRQLQSQMCARPDVGGGPCPGDSGSPIMFNGVGVGLISVGIGSICDQGIPLVYSHIYSFLDWIEEVVAS